MENKHLSEKKVIIASYTHIADGKYTTIGGPALAIKDYLKNKVKRLTCIWQPLPISDTLSVVTEIYEENKLAKAWKLPVINWPFGRGKAISLIYIALKIRDIFSVPYFVLRSNCRYDYFIGIEALNALSGVLLRKMGIVKRVIYYNFDYGEVRFKNKPLNSLFHFLDKIAINYADYTWYFSEYVLSARKKRGILEKDKLSSQLIVPIGINFSKTKFLPIDSIDRKRIVYLGTLYWTQGVHLIIESLPDILKIDKDIKLVIIGSGVLERELKHMVKEKNLDGYVKFTGIISDEEAEKILSGSGIGVAPYFPDPHSTRIGSDPTKPKIYLSCGLPVVITRVPPIAEEIEKNQLGIAINYNKKELIAAIQRLINDSYFYEECRKNIVNFIYKYDWEIVLGNAFKALYNMNHG